MYKRYYKHRSITNNIVDIVSVNRRSNDLIAATMSNTQAGNCCINHSTRTYRCRVVLRYTITINHRNSLVTGITIINQNWRLYLSRTHRCTIIFVWMTCDETNRRAHGSNKKWILRTTVIKISRITVINVWRTDKIRFCNGQSFCRSHYGHYRFYNWFNLLLIYATLHFRRRPF